MRKNCFTVETFFPKSPLVKWTKINFFYCRGTFFFTLKKNLKFSAAKTFFFFFWKFPLPLDFFGSWKKRRKMLHIVGKRLLFWHKLEGLFHVVAEVERSVKVEKWREHRARRPRAWELEPGIFLIASRAPGTWYRNLIFLTSFPHRSLQSQRSLDVSLFFCFEPVATWRTI